MKGRRKRGETGRWEARGSRREGKERRGRDGINLPHGRLQFHRNTSSEFRRGARWRCELLRLKNELNGLMLVVLGRREFCKRSVSCNFFLLHFAADLHFTRFLQRRDGVRGVRLRTMFS